MTIYFFLYKSNNAKLLKQLNNVFFMIKVHEIKLKKKKKHECYIL